MKVLGIESSCDETGIAVYDTASGAIWQRLYSQIEKHREYGGVVPELASRDHVVKAAPMLLDILDEIGGVEALDGIAYTRGPGLIGALMAARSMKFRRAGFLSLMPGTCTLRPKIVVTKPSARAASFFSSM